MDLVIQFILITKIADILVNEFHDKSPFPDLVLNFTGLPVTFVQVEQREVKQISVDQILVKLFIELDGLNGV